MATINLVQGINTVRWSLNGYNTLEAQITVSADGAVTCTSVSGGSCGSTTPPGVKIAGSKTAGYTITGYLQQSTSQTPTPTPVPNPDAQICKWIEAKGGARSLKGTDVYEIEDAYAGLRNIGFTPTAKEVYGVEDYYAGFIESGNSLTGCRYT